LHPEEEDATAADERLVTGAPSFHVSQKQQLLYKEIERFMKHFKTHRCALDFDQRFVKAELREEEGWHHKQQINEEVVQYSEYVMCAPKDMRRKEIG